MIVGLDVKSNINLESGGVIPAVVKGVAPMFLPVPQPGAPETIIGPRFGPSRLFEFQCDPQLFSAQQQDPALCALEQAVQNDDGTTLVHGDGHRQGNRSAMLHFRTQEAGFIPEDGENGEVEVTLLYAVEDENGDREAFVGTDLVKTLPVPQPP